MKRLLLLGETEIWAHWTVLPAVLSGVSVGTFFPASAL